MNGLILELKQLLADLDAKGNLEEAAVLRFLIAKYEVKNGRN